jgi:hypothetical protein
LGIPVDAFPTAGEFCAYAAEDASGKRLEKNIGRMDE